MTRRRAPPDLLAILEAAYEVESSSWLENVLAAARPSFDRGLGTCGFLYDASRPGRLWIGDIVELGAPVPITATSMGRSILTGVDAPFVNATYRSKAASTASEEPAFNGPHGPGRYLRRFGIADIQVVNALDSSGKGLVLASYLPAATRLTAAERVNWTRVAAHLASAYRLRRRTRRRTLGSLAVADTVMTTSGQIEHAGADAASARTALRNAVVAYGRAKGALRSNPQAALEAWQALVDHRWTLLDVFDSDGSKYVIARRNDAPDRGPRALTQRERQVLAYAALGHENKLIAYSLGITHATVRVLIARAAKKFAVRTREALLAAFLATND